ncbi:MAG: TolC family protein [Bacteroidota bacterium]|nr:TolC family protein [Bacteroidota bacterium]
MKIRTVFIVSLFLVMYQTGIAQNTIAGNQFTLQQCIETGLANNLIVFQSGMQMQNSKIAMNQAKLNLLPDINGSASQNFSHGRSIDPYSNSPVTQGVSSSNFNLNSGVILFNGFSLQNTIKQYSLAYEASKMEWQQAKDNLTISIILEYLQVLSSGEQLEQVKNTVTYSEKEVERLTALNKEGAIRPSDLSDFKGQYAGEQLSIINAQTSLETAKITLCQLMNIPYNKDITLEKIEPGSFTTKYDDTPDKIYQTALQQFAVVKATDLRTKSAEKALKVARGQLFPTLRFGVNVSTNYSSVAFQSQYLNTVYGPTSDSANVNNIKYPVYKFRDNFTTLSKISYRDQLNNNLYTVYGFSLNIPIFNNFVQRDRIKQAKITLKSNEFVAKTTRTQLSQSIDQAYIYMVSASDSYKILIDQAEAYKESFRAAEVRFNQGVGTSLEYLTAKNNFDKANFSLIAAKYDYVLRTKVLDYYQGKKLW